MPYVIILRRANGRFVKELERCRSKYAAKRRAAHYVEKYDPSYVIEIEAA
jgi:hypothetical protein